MLNKERRKGQKKYLDIQMRKRKIDFKWNRNRKDVEKEDRRWNIKKRIPRAERIPERYK